LTGYATQSWVNTQLAGYLPLTGGTLSGGLTAQNGIIITGSPYYQNGDFIIKNAINSSQMAFGHTMSEYLMGFMQFNEVTKGVASSDNSIRFHIFGHDNLLNILGSGNVGIGTTTPAYKLEVNGQVLINGQTHIVASGIGFNRNVTTGGIFDSNYNGGQIFYNNYYDGLEFGLLTSSNASYNIGMFLQNSGNLGIGTITPSYKLDVKGSANATTLYENGSRVITTANIGSQSVNYATSAGSANHAKILGHEVYENTYHSLSNGDTLVYDTGTGWLNYPSGLSDIRKKDVINYNAEPTFEAVANAPAIRFTWKDANYSFRRGIHVGSIAQYWQTTLPEAVTMDNEGMLSMQYDVIALLSTISVAKKVSENERRIIILERENEELRKELAALKSA
jgi:hypothetical protein